jgi:hypothetical protein
MRWNIPRSRKLYLLLLLTASVGAGFAAYHLRKDAGPRPTYEEQCAMLCGSLPSRVKKNYVDPISPESRRNMPRSIECMCGSSVIGKQLF